MCARTLEIRMESKKLPAVRRDESWALRLGGKTPETTTRELEKKLHTLFDKGFKRNGIASSGEYGFDYIVTGYDIDSIDRNKLEEAYIIAKKSIEPYPKVELEKQLEVLYSIQAKVGEITAKKKAKLMALLMLELPADLANYTIKYNSKYNKFWSTYEELYNPIYRKLESRLSLIKTLENKLNTM